MIAIFSGDDTVSSRKAYTDQIELLKKENEIEFVSAKDIDEVKLENIFGSTDLFGKSRVLAMENFFSGQKNKKRDEIISKIVLLPSGLIVDWEEKEISKTEIAKLGEDCVVKNFKLPNLLFNFLDSLIPGKTKENLQTLHRVLENSEPHIVFSMIVRQIKLLLLAGDDELDSLTPWQAGKIKKQSNLFEREKLIIIFKKLAEMDYREKTSQSPFGLSSELDILVAGI